MAHNFCASSEMRLKHQKGGDEGDTSHSQLASMADLLQMLHPRQSLGVQALCAQTDAISALLSTQPSLGKCVLCYH